MTLIWSPESIHDLISLRAHIAEHDSAAARRVALHILYCVENLLSEDPRLGAPGRVPGTRELVIPKTPYVVLYVADCSANKHILLSSEENGEPLSSLWQVSPCGR